MKHDSKGRTLLNVQINTKQTHEHRAPNALVFKVSSDLTLDVCCSAPYLDIFQERRVKELPVCSTGPSL